MGFEWKVGLTRTGVRVLSAARTVIVGSDWSGRMSQAAEERALRWA